MLLGLAVPVVRLGDGGPSLPSSGLFEKCVDLMVVCVRVGALFIDGYFF